METRRRLKDRGLELGVEFLFELLIFFYPFGADQMGIPHNFWLGFISWIAGLLIALRIFWIFPWWADRLSVRRKASISIATVLLFGLIVWKPVQSAYDRAHTAPPPPSPPFSFKIETFAPHDAVRFSIVVSDTYCAPRYSIYLDVTNNQQHFVRIDRFAVELLASSGAWMKSGIISPSGVLVLGRDLQTNLPIEAIKLLDQEIENKNLGPKETISGWLFLETDDVFTPAGGFKFSVTDEEGNQSQSEPIITSETAGIGRSYYQLGGAGGKFIDLTKLTERPCQPKW